LGLQALLLQPRYGKESADSSRRQNDPSTS
jgi:hypothetical protein